MTIYEYLLMTSDLVLILGGATMFWLSPRLKRNWLLGYGSPRSMISDTSWRTANRFAGLMLASLALVAMSIQVSAWHLIVETEIAQAAAVAVPLLIPFAVMYLTEKHLSNKFES